MRPFSSIVTRINIALACIVTLAIGTMLVSYWLSDKADSHAQAINKAGALRMQTYRLGWLSLQNDEAIRSQAIAQLNQSWQHPVFTRVKNDNFEIAQLFNLAQSNWQTIQSSLKNDDYQWMDNALKHQVALIDEMVRAIQGDAEKRARALRLVQVIALFFTVMLSLTIKHWLKVKIELPLDELTRTARQIGQGDFTCRVEVHQQDELGALAQSINKMSNAIGYMYGDLEKRVDEKTKDLQQRNTLLKFLYKTAKKTAEHGPEYDDFSAIINELKTIILIDDIELCLFTEKGEIPYLQLQPTHHKNEPCHENDCVSCLSREGVIQQDNILIYNFSVSRNKTNYGVLIVRTPANAQLEQWQRQLLNTLSDQLAIALSLKTEEEQVRRLALMQERTVIARELHDSLAQALSYLKIQVTRLNYAIKKEDKNTINDVSAELEHGLKSAYRQLRELLTTFRLKVDGSGLLNALQVTVQQLMKQSNLTITLDYQLNNIPLTPNEEIHLLQIIREASQNAVHHSKGTQLTISVQQQADKSVFLSIEDNGIGIPVSSEKLNHYGLAIMKERSRHLGGDITVERRAQGGTGIYFTFKPDYLQEKQTA
ncbi:ATP-binding protein [Alteromonas sp. 14N.309.X.WAT.G.H12]|uniref:ATP-binding protein n=1 Tax=Alteromonas sp. 14N.309.X.WAT.G.H12 TaxID=3120824 RepID=UPI002FCE70E5